MGRDQYYPAGQGGAELDVGPAFDTDGAFDYLYRNANPVEHARLAHWKGEADTTIFWRTFERYQNPDGGWAHGIEPDYQGQESSIQSTLEALRIMVTHHQADHPSVGRTVQFLRQNMLPDGTWQERQECLDAGAPDWYQPAKYRLWETASIAGYCLELGFTEVWSSAARYVRSVWREVPPPDSAHHYWATLLLLGRSHSDQDRTISRECIEAFKHFIRRERIDAYDCSWIIEVITTMDRDDSYTLLPQLGDMLASSQEPGGGVRSAYGEHFTSRTTFNALMAVALLNQSLSRVR